MSFNTIANTVAIDGVLHVRLLGPGHESGDSTGQNLNESIRRIECQYRSLSSPQHCNTHVSLASASSWAAEFVILHSYKANKPIRTWTHSHKRPERTVDSVRDAVSSSLLEDHRMAEAADPSRSHIRRQQLITFGRSLAYAWLRAEGFTCAACTTFSSVMRPTARHSRAYSIYRANAWAKPPETGSKTPSLTALGVSTACVYPWMSAGS